MMRLYFLQKSLDYATPEVLTAICEYLLWCSKMHINFLEDKLCNSFFHCILHCFRNWPAHCIVNRCNDPAISIFCHWKPSDEVYSPPLERFNFSGRRQLCILSLLSWPLPLRYLAVWTRFNKFSDILVQFRPPCACLHKVSHPLLGQVPIFFMHSLDEVATELPFQIWSCYSL